MNQNIHNFPRGRPGVQRILEPILLLFLTEKPSYGYELLEKIRNVIPGWEEPDVGALYRFLRRLEKEQLLISNWSVEKIGPARRIYHITESGERYLQLWMERLEKNRNLIDSLLDQSKKLTRQQPPEI